MDVARYPVMLRVAHMTKVACSRPCSAEFGEPCSSVGGLRKTVEHLSWLVGSLLQGLKTHTLFSHRVRLVERGAPQSLLLSESGKVIGSVSPWEGQPAGRMVQFKETCSQFMC